MKVFVRKYDIAVIGAGIAGLSAAVVAAEAGAKVIVLERAAKIGIPIRCGELVRIDTLQYLLGSMDSLIRQSFNSYKICVDDDNFFSVVSPLKFAACINKFSLIQLLLNRVLTANADVWTGCSVKSIERNKEKIHIFLDNISLKEIKVDDVIICDGVASRIAPMLGIKTSLPQKGIASCVSAVLDSHDIFFNECKLYFNSEIAPGGYFWVFPTSRMTANVGVGVNSTMSSNKSSFQYLKSYIERRYPTAKLSNTVFGGIPVYYPLRYFSYPNVAIAGDAARQVDPLTGAGITTSIFAAMLAAKSVMKTRDISYRRTLYDDVWRCKFDTMFKNSINMRKQLNFKQDSELLGRVNTLSKHGVKSISVNYSISQLAMI